MTEIEKKLRENIKLSMKNGSNFDRDVYRTLLSEIQSKSSGNKKQLKEEDVESIVSKYINSCKDSASFFQDGDERKKSLLKECELLEEFVPKYMSESDIKEYVKNNIDLSNFDNKGKAIGHVISSLKENGHKAEGKTVSKVISSLI